MEDMIGRPGSEVCEEVTPMPSVNGVTELHVWLNDWLTEIRANSSNKNAAK